jgi:hypothetical protein
VYLYLENRYAKAADVEQVKQRLDYKITNDYYQSVQQRIWSLKDKYGENPKDPTVRGELRKLQSEQDALSKRLDTIRSKKSDGN